MSVGLFGRQAAIDIVVPRWVTLYVTAAASADSRGFVERFMECVATIGATGMTVIMDATPQEIGDMKSSLSELCRKRIFPTRPYFWYVLSNRANAVANAGEVVAGELVVFHNSNQQTMHVTTPPAEVPAEVLGDAVAAGLDLGTGMIFKTNKPAELLAEVCPQAEVPWTLPHWQDAVSAQLLHQSCAVMLTNVLAKPHKYEPNRLFFVGDYLDEVIARSFNERCLRARWQEK